VSDDAAHRKGTRLVAAQFALIALCLLPLGPTLGTGQLRPVGVACLVLAAGVGLLGLLGLGADTRVHPVPHEQSQLHTRGIYAWIRHPMYAAVLLACLGVTFSSGRVLSLVAVVVLAGVLRVKWHFEDHLLEERFGSQFTAYAARVPAVVPAPWRSHRK
jgi:protein-S-isoprenylcysteine O-methyltransferase Ste14